jgi:hypothetical protein
MHDAWSNYELCVLQYSAEAALVSTWCQRV